MDISQLPEGKKIILFDGPCSLCNNMIRFVAGRDKKDVFRFVSLQSDLGQNILRHIGVDQTRNDTVILYEPGIAYHIKSSAALEIARHLSGLGRIDILLRIFPTFFRDAVYNLVAANRHRWQSDTCALGGLEGKILE